MFFWFCLDLPGYVVSERITGGFTVSVEMGSFYRYKKIAKKK